MRFGKSVLALLAVFILLSASSADSFTVKGRAYGLYVNAPSLGVTDQTYCDTGLLPPNGGSLGESVTNFSVTGVASGDVVGAFSDGDDCEGDSDVIYTNGVILPGHPAEITFSSLSGDDDDECCNPGDDDDDDDFTVQTLTFGGNPIVVTGAKNQVHTLVGVGELTINELVYDDDDDEECDEDDDFRVNGLHLRLDNGEEIIVGSVYFDSDDDCCAVPTENKTWGAIKDLFILMGK